MPGRLPKPAALKLLNGNPGRRPVGEDPQAAGTPQHPDWLDGESRKVWRRLRSSLPKGLLARADEGLLLTAAVSLAQYREIARMIQATKPTSAEDFTVKHCAMHRVALAHMNTYLQAAARLGLSPVDRARLATDPRDKPDPLATMLSNKPKFDVHSG